jgi:hypothetical protein
MNFCCLLYVSRDPTIFPYFITLFVLMEYKNYKAFYYTVSSTVLLFLITGQYEVKRINRVF